MPYENKRKTAAKRYGKNKNRATLKEKLLGSARLATPAESAEFFDDDDFRWAETLSGDDANGEPVIYINDKKFKDAGSTNYRDKMHLLESLHRLKDVDKERYDTLFNAAVTNPEYQKWAQESYEHTRNQSFNKDNNDFITNPGYLETRNFDDWHSQSRFDQVMGGYLMSGDKDIPTAKNWSRDLPFGDDFKKELELLEQDLK
tara:strand:- start:2507 stop:3112 length:606 start_codon:yes stop_codon:yes gene_type:complete